MEEKSYTKCILCNKEINLANEYYVTTEDGVMCEDCSYDLEDSQCIICDYYIEPGENYVEKDGIFYHIKCIDSLLAKYFNQKS